MIAGGGLLLLARHALKTQDEIAKLSTAIGVSTEALGGLHLAAGLFGSSAAEINKALPKMQKAIGDADRGLAETRDVFISLGLEIDHLKSLAPEDQFGAIAGAINKLPTAVDRTTAAMTLFGRSGAKLLPLMQAGEEGLLKIRKEAMAMGVALSRQDTGRLEMVNDSILRIKTAIVGLVTTLLLRLAPIIEAVAQGATKLAIVFKSALSPGIVRTVLAITAFTVASIAIIRIIAFVVSTFKILVGAYQALTAAQIIQKAFSGPAGWAVIATGAVIAAGAIAGLSVYFSKLNADMNAATGEMAGVTKGANAMNAALAGGPGGEGGQFRAVQGQAERTRFAPTVDPFAAGAASFFQQKMGQPHASDLIGKSLASIDAKMDQVVLGAKSAQAALR
tara:strand:+ start:42 stop:1217 length:1176 start_codon:yes stop_codon:yes gene_type:complete